MDLEDIFSQGLSSVGKEKEIVPVSSQIGSESQLPLFEGLVDCHQVTQTVGVFYEELLRGLVGGERGHRFHVPGFTGNDVVIQPDLFRSRSSVPLTVEVKGMHSTSEGVLFDDQVARYVLLQRDLPEYSVFFAFCQYNGSGLSSDSRSGVFRHLAENTSRITFLPLSLVVGLHQVGVEGKGKLFLSRSESKGAGVDAGGSGVGGGLGRAYTGIRSRALDLLVSDYGSLIGLAGLDHGHYQNFKVHSPSSISFHNTRVRSFPLRLVADVDHERWVRGFCSGLSYRQEEGVLSSGAFQQGAGAYEYFAT